MHRPISGFRRYLPIAIIVLAAVGLYGILPQIDGFTNSLQAMRSAKPELLVLAVGANIVAYICAACVYMSLALKPLRFGPTLLVQLAGLLINRVLPAGIGGLGLNFLYLRGRKHTNVQAATVATLSNSIGFVGHFLLLTLATLFGSAALVSLEVSSRQIMIVAGVAVAILLAALIGWRLARKRVKSIWKQFKTTLTYYRKRPSKLVAALLFSCGLTLSNVLSLWLCAHALGIDLSFYAIFILFTAGIAVGTAIPTPGGLGGLEAAIVAGMISQHVDPALALAAVLLYRLLSFWLGLLIGGVATLFVQQQHLLRRA